MDISTNPARSVSSLTSSAAPSSSTGTLREKAIELEGVFLNTLVSQMFSGLDARGDFGGGYAEETWRSMQSELLASQLANNGGVGLADQIMSDLIAMQEANAPQRQMSAPSAKPYGANQAQNSIASTSIGAF